MEIFETKSKYYKNPNAKFAGMFSNMAITVTVILIGIVLLVWFGISCLHGHWEHKLTNNVLHQLQSYGFTGIKGLEMIANLDEGTGQERLRFEFGVDHIKNPKLCNGEDCPGTHIIATTQSWGGAEFNVENIALKYLPGPAQDIPNWVNYAYEYDKIHPPPPLTEEEKVERDKQMTEETNAFIRKEDSVTCYSSGANCN